MEDAVFAGTEHSAAAAADAHQLVVVVTDELPTQQLASDLVDYGEFRHWVHAAVVDLEVAGYDEDDILEAYGQMVVGVAEALQEAAASPPGAQMIDLPWYANGGFGAVPASAAAVAGLEKRAFVRAAAAGGHGGVTACGICLEGFVDGEEVSVMPCASTTSSSRGHEFHAGCIAKWLGQYSNVCPLCRHALPTSNGEEDD